MCKPPDALITEMGAHRENPQVTVRSNEKRPLKNSGAFQCWRCMADGSTNSLVSSSIDFWSGQGCEPAERTKDCLSTADPTETREGMPPRYQGVQWHPLFPPSNGSTAPFFIRL